MRGSSFRSYIRSGDEKPKMTWDLMKRVLAYSAAYRWHLAGMLALILASSGLSLLSPLILRDLIEQQGDLLKLRHVMDIGMYAFPMRVITKSGQERLAPGNSGHLIASSRQQANESGPQARRCANDDCASL